MKDAIRRKGKNKVYIDATISPNKPKNCFKEYNKWRNRIKINIKEKAQRNKANQELKNFLSSFFSISKSDVKIVKGKKKKQKTIALSGASHQEVVSRISDELN